MNDNQVRSRFLFAIGIICLALWSIFYLYFSVSGMWLRNPGKQNDYISVQYFFMLAMADHNMLAHELIDPSQSDKIDDWFSGTERLAVRRVGMAVGSPSSFSVNFGTGCSLTVGNLQIEAVDEEQYQVIGWDSLEWTTCDFLN